MLVALTLISLRPVGIDNSMWRVPYIYFLVLTLCPSWYQTIGFGSLSGVLVFFVMWLACRLRLRMVVRAVRVRFDERLAKQIRIAHELHDTMLQTVQGSKFV